MEAEFPNTPGFFSAAIGGQDNVFDQSFAMHDVQGVRNSHQMDWTLASLDQMNPRPSDTLHYPSPPLPATSHYPSPPNPTVSFPDQSLGNADFIADFDTNFNTSFADSPLDFHKKDQRQAESSQKLDTAVPSRSYRIESGHFTPPSKSVSPTTVEKDGTAPRNEQDFGGQCAQIPVHSSLGGTGVEDVSKAVDQPPKKRTRRSRKRNPPSAEAERQKREKLLERNRVAASKCRLKRKSYTNTLEDKARDLQHRRESLSMLANSLKDEVLFLKGQMLRHTDCGCSRVRDYLNNEADSLACASRSRLMSDGSNVRKSSTTPISPSLLMDTDAECSASVASESPMPNEQNLGSLDFLLQGDKP